MNRRTFLASDVGKRLLHRKLKWRRVKMFEPFGHGYLHARAPSGIVRLMIPSIWKSCARNGFARPLTILNEEKKAYSERGVLARKKGKHRYGYLDWYQADI